MFHWILRPNQHLRLCVVLLAVDKWTGLRLCRPMWNKLYPDAFLSEPALYILVIQAIVARLLVAAFTPHVHLWPRGLAITIWLLSNPLKSVHLPIFRLLTLSHFCITFLWLIAILPWDSCLRVQTANRLMQPLNLSYCWKAELNLLQSAQKKWKKSRFYLQYIVAQLTSARDTLKRKKVTCN